MISLIIPTTGTNQDYTDNLVSNIESLYPNRDEVEIIVHIDSTVTLGLNYNNTVKKAKGDKIILLHNDMVLSAGFIETMGKHIQKGRITTYTRVEPPIYSDTYPGKIIMDCGKDLLSFNKDKFNSIPHFNTLTDGGSQLFFGCMKEDYIGIDGYTFKMFCEDDDLHLRYRLAGFEHKVSSAYVYHFVSKTSRATNDYQQIEYNSNKNFIRKWGSRNPSAKYNIGFVVKNCNLQALEYFEPLCDNIYIDDEMQVLTIDYLDKEQKNTNFKLGQRIKYNRYDVPKNDIIVEFDYLKWNPESWDILMQLPNIIQDNGEIGMFELDIFKITINSMEEQQSKLIYLKDL
jgi:hypothetical protein